MLGNSGKDAPILPSLLAPEQGDPIHISTDRNALGQLWQGHISKRQIDTGYLGNLRHLLRGGRILCCEVTLK
jgi:hypothetical protein